MASETTHYLIVGGSAAGMAAAQAIRETDPEKSIVVLSQEPDPPYFRPLIPYLVTGHKDEGDMALIGSGPYTATGIHVRINSPVSGVEVDRKTALLDDGQAIVYDKLLLSTGSRPHIPPDIKGTRASGVYALRTLTDAREMNQRATHARHAVMLGGGLLNLKAAFALLERGLQVTLIVFSPEVLSQLMEPADADLIRQALDNAGLEIKTGRSATAVLSGPDGVQGVVLDDGSELSCQMVCIGKGVQPNIEFLADTPIDINEGIEVDPYTATNQADVFAAGDVAATIDPLTGNRIVTGLWTHAAEMGRCAGFNMAGRQTAYTGTFGIMNATQLAGQPFVSMGTVHTAGTDYDVQIRHTDDAYRKLVFNAEGDRLIGALFIGDISRAGMYRYIMRENRPIRKIKHLMISHKLHYGHLVIGH